MSLTLWFHIDFIIIILGLICGTLWTSSSSSVQGLDGQSQRCWCMGIKRLSPGDLQPPACHFLDGQTWLCRGMYREEAAMLRPHQPQNWGDLLCCPHLTNSKGRSRGHLKFSTMSKQEGNQSNMSQEKSSPATSNPPAMQHRSIQTRTSAHSHIPNPPEDRNPNLQNKPKLKFNCFCLKCNSEPLEFCSDVSRYAWSSNHHWIWVTANPFRGGEFFRGALRNAKEQRPVALGAAEPPRLRNQMVLIIRACQLGNYWWKHSLEDNNCHHGLNVAPKGSVTSGTCTKQCISDTSFQTYKLRMVWAGQKGYPGWKTNTQCTNTSTRQTGNMSP